MRVAMLSSISWRTPPRAYGPWELVTSLLTEGLVARGVDVTLFATADSITAGKLAAVAPRPYSEDPAMDGRVWELMHAAHLFERASEFDIIHNQADFIPLSFAHLTDTPIVTTIHGFSSERILPLFQRAADRVAYVSISDADRSPGLNYAATIYHGIPLAEFPFNARGGEDFLFYGRIHPDKGAAEAIAVAKRAGRRLQMAGIVHDEGYFKREVEPHIDGERVIFHGAVGGARRAELLGSCAALLHLINFNEPFGLSVVEAMACGTPVIAVARGSMPELIADGETGFLVRDAGEADRALTQLGKIDRATCREAAERRFSVERMVDDYLALYERLLKR
jgi:glycosyltransferase involved in cell wall biosynthesis